VEPSGKVGAHEEYYSKIAKITIAEKLFIREYERLRNALGGTTHELINQYELQRAGHPYYNSRSGGGEGHLEIAKISIIRIRIWRTWCFLSNPSVACPAHRAMEPRPPWFPFQGHALPPGRNLGRG